MAALRAPVLDRAVALVDDVRLGVFVLRHAVRSRRRGVEEPTDQVGEDVSGTVVEVDVVGEQGQTVASPDVIPAPPQQEVSHGRLRDE